MTLKEIAELLGVSPSSISIVRNGQSGVSALTRQRIQLALDENGYSYVPYIEFRAPQKLPEQSMHCIRLLKFFRSALLTDRNEGFVDNIIDAIDTTARAKGYSLLVSSIPHNEYDKFIDSLCDDCSVGIIVIATEMERNEIMQLKRVQIPVVILDCDHAALPFSSVTMDNRDIAYRSVSELSSSNEVGYICSRIRTGNFIQRGNGYNEAVHDLGLPCGDEMLFMVTPSLTGAFEDMKQLLSNGRRVPRAFFADNDVIAIGAMRALALKGYSIPQDIRIIGVDNTMLSQATTPTLSSTHISRIELGETAIRLLLEQILSPSKQIVHINIGSKLIHRESTYYDSL